MIQTELDLTNTQSSSEQTFKKICIDNNEAKLFCIEFRQFCHLLDDIIDQDKPLDDERLIKETLSFLQCITLNAFYNQYKLMLWPIIVQSFNAWLDANNLEHTQKENEKRTADVIKGMYHEVIYFTAYIIGGWDHLRNTTSTLRRYDFD